MPILEPQSPARPGHPLEPLGLRPAGRPGLSPAYGPGDPGGSRALVVGLGRTGLSVARFLARHGIAFAVADTRAQPPCLTEFQQTLPDAALFLGALPAEAFAAATHIIASPGMPLDRPEIAAAARRGLPVLGDLDLFACAAPAPAAAITGANGKSTVTTLLGLMAEADGRRVRVGGNLGTPMLDLLDDEAELYVLELSSFQLERSSRLEPAAATVLNISPDHLDRYPGLDAYAEAKRRVFRGDGLQVINRDDPLVAAMAGPGRRCVGFSLADPAAEYGVKRIEGEEWLVGLGQPLMKAAEVRLQGRHNLANALAAVALGDAVGLSRAAMVAELGRFPGLDHRMQWVAETGGVAWINDSKATNVGACVAALAGLDRKAVLIAGGDGKGADFNLLRAVVAEKVRAAVLTGRDAPLLEAALGDLVPLARAGDMREAVLAAQALALPGDAVLLAPACASLDQYRDYQERGRLFAEAVRGLGRASDG
jgi:UDP-N-acetylmuramoylalanine--D-glutamate ligase